MASIKSTENISQLRRIYNSIDRAQDQLSDTSLQIASNQKHQSFTELAESGSIERVFSFEAQITAIDGYNRNNTRVVSRLRTMEQAIETMTDIAESYMSTLAKKRSAVGDSVPVTQEGNSALKQIQQNLNLRSEGRYLFAGSRTDAAPVGDIVNTTNVINDNPSANYYNGDSVTLSIQVSEGQEFSYGVKANESAFQNLIASIHTALEGDADNDDDKIVDAINYMNTAIQSLASLRGSVANSINIIETAAQSNEDSQLLIKANYSKITDTDIIEASTVISELEAQITASFQSWNILANLNLSRFLNG